MPLFPTLRSLFSLRTTLRELRLTRLALQDIAAALTRAYPMPQALPVRAEDDPAVDVAYVDADQQAAWVDAEQRLTAARGSIPTEEEIFEELERRAATGAAGASGGVQ